MRGVGVTGHGVAVHIHAGRAEGISRIHHAQAVVLPQKGLPVLRAGLDVIDSLDISDVGMDCGIGQCAVLRDRRSLQVGRSQVGQRIAAGIVVILIPADKGSQVEDRIIADDARISWRNVESPNLRALIGIANTA